MIEKVKGNLIRKEILYDNGPTLIHFLKGRENLINEF
jgi:hypothetical protein